MAQFRLSAAILGALVLSGTGVAAHAQPAKPKPPVQGSFTTRESQTPSQNPLAPPSTRKTVQYDSPRHWGFRLDVDQPVNREARLKDAEVGAYYRLSPSLRIGGALGLADKAPPQPKPVETDQTTPRVRLETALKF